MCATLLSSDSSKEPLAFEIARDVLDILENLDRHAIVDELVSRNIAAELQKRVGHTREFGFRKVRKEIARNETNFSNNFQYIRDLLQHGEEEAVTENCSYCPTRDLDASTKKAFYAPRNARSFAPSSSAFADPDTEHKDWA